MFLFFFSFFGESSIYQACCSKCILFLSVSESHLL
ncbi:putative signal peptide protein [Puccinia sorghi]|uniref:Putative signal peptide protein n=1 Tax=Puccinia sorghi TaxID=27349 RepID=A0A0L6UTF6_9BASI|nr:putative signal peptide protein [Puccinia sorghi]